MKLKSQPIGEYRLGITKTGRYYQPDVKNENARIIDILTNGKIVVHHRKIYFDGECWKFQK